MHKTVVIDPAGTHPEWLYVVVRRKTGVSYEQQYGGTACLQGEVEGFLVPVYSETALVELRSFFEGTLEGIGMGPRNADEPPEFIELIARAVESIEYWPADEGASQPLVLDRSQRCDEAWIPVLTPDGPGVLIWCNSD